jgi:hypothetical protein
VGQVVSCSILAAQLHVTDVPVDIVVHATVPATTGPGLQLNQAIVTSPEDPAPCEVSASAIVCLPPDTDNYAQARTLVTVVASNEVRVAPAPTRGALAFTGSGALRLAAGGLALLVVGLALVLVRRRREATTD